MEFTGGPGQNGLPPQDMNNFQAALSGLLALMLCALPADGSPRRHAAIRMNVQSVEWASSLIALGRFVPDKKGAWNKDRPSRSRENDFVRDSGFQEYAKWFLAVDDAQPANSKAKYKFPFGDFRNIHRCGLLAAKARAHEYGYSDIEAAAGKLLEMIKSPSPARQKHVD